MNLLFVKAELENFISEDLSDGHKVLFSYIDIFYIHLTLTRSIGLPPHAPVAQKNADQR